MALFIMVAHLLPDVPNKIYLTHFSSAAVGVFFFYSGYGLYLSMETKDKYMNGFVYKRIFKKLYIPFVLVNLLYYIYNLMCGKAGNVLSIFGIGLLTDTNWYVIEILVYYVMFYIFFHRKNTSAAFWCAVAAYVLSIFVMAVWGNLCNIGLCWYISSSGFIIGMIYKNIVIKL